MFSVIIPLYNKELYIQKAIQSVLNQTVSDFEIIVVDNNSSDLSFEKAKSIIDPRIRFVSEKTKGVSSARNKGIQEAKFDYICFLDADDFWLENHLSHLKNLIQLHPNAGLYANSYFIVESNGNQRERIFSQSKEGENIVLKNYFKDISSGDSPIHIDAACVPKSVLLKLGCFNPEIHYGEDSLLWSLIFLNYSIILSNFADVVYVRSADNRSDTPEKLCNELPVVKELEKLLLHQNALKFQDDIRACIAKQLFLNLVSCLKTGRMKEARAFVNDARISYFPSTFKLKFLTVLSYLPGFVTKFILVLLFNLKLVK
jgi:glycosyltransferase involved in cell wall biosynthesis